MNYCIVLHPRKWCSHVVYFLFYNKYLAKKKKWRKKKCCFSSCFFVVLDDILLLKIKNGVVCIIENNEIKLGSDVYYTII